MKTITILLLASCCLQMPPANADDFSGEYVFNSPAGAVKLVLEEDAQGTVSGSMSDGMSSIPLQGRSQGGVASGRIRADYEADFEFRAQLDESGDLLFLEMRPVDTDGTPLTEMSEPMAFVRSGAAGESASSDAAAAAPPPHGDGVASNVFVNGKALTRDQVAQFEQQYQTKLVDGRYWYDDKCGGWGIEGGPTVGFILPSLPLPGPMPANISGGGTGIFINGRELHPVDRQVLVGMFGMALPGRYWLDAYGNLGIEGGGFLVNLAVAAQQLQQQTTQTQHGTVSTGPEGAMFSGRDLSTGKPTFWYSGM